MNAVKAIELDYCTWETEDQTVWEGIHEQVKEVLNSKGYIIGEMNLINDDDDDKLKGNPHYGMHIQEKEISIKDVPEICELISASNQYIQIRNVEFGELTNGYNWETSEFLKIQIRLLK